MSLEHTPLRCPRLALVGLSLLTASLAGLHAPESLGRAFYSVLSLQGVAFVGFALCVRCLVLGTWRPSLGVALALVCALRLLALPLTPTLSDDVYRYVWEGRVGLAGENPYLHAPDDEVLATLRDDAIWPRINHPDIPAAYPPFLQAALRLGVCIDDTPLGQKIVFGLADVLVVILLWALLARHRQAPSLALVYGLAPLPILEFSGMAHSDSLTVLLTLTALLAHRQRHRALSGALLGCAAATKVLPICLLPFFVRRNGWIPALSASLTILALVAPWVPHDDPLRVLEGNRAYAAFGASAWNLYPVLLAALGDAGGVKLALACLALSVLVIGWRRRVSAERFAVWLALFFLACAPTIHPWYFAAYLLPICCFLRAPLWLLTGWTIVGSYHQIPAWIDHGIWQRSPWWTAFAWAPFWLGWVGFGLRLSARHSGTTPSR